ncbi:homoserine dehydrogenase [Methanomassiliicoccus luminyensis]|uniref:homoserine dehydrogenase n=1 Tax=Methanomassiliicoccus luminyensis TaxID=1080712 RepID=UPI00037CC389|nr:homoserine dehydrogenase [Methanomassiliicoccus luminyensis]
MRVLIAGFGTVGQGIAEVIGMRQNLFSSEFGQKVEIIGAFDSSSFAGNPRGLDPAELVSQKKTSGKVGVKRADDMVKLIGELDYDALIETTPTNVVDSEPGLTYITTALNAGKNVITSNKGPLALKFRELCRTAEKNDVQLRYEASVGGAMPIINLSRELLRGEQIYSLRGILNGTCNFILNRMKDEGLPFEQALREAQELGYAERDPTYDIDGVDSAAKLAILANAIFGMNVTYHDVTRTGIRNISEEAIAMASEQNKVIRLIGEISGNKLEVSPRLVPSGHPLSIGGTLNIVQLITDLAGEVTVAGRGAGRMETASAMLSDIIAILTDEQAKCR